MKVMDIEQLKLQVPYKSFDAQCLVLLEAWLAGQLGGEPQFKLKL